MIENMFEKFLYLNPTTCITFAFLHTFFTSNVFYINKNTSQIRLTIKIQKICIFLGVDHVLGVCQYLGVAPKHIPFCSYTFYLFLAFSFFSICDKKVVKTPQKISFTSKHHVKHPFPGQSTQGTWMFTNNQKLF